MWACRLLLVCCLLGALPAQAFERPFPPNARRGAMTPAPWPTIVIDGLAVKLAPGARIWNRDNLIQMPATLRGFGIPVNYTVNQQGEVDRVWILTADEMQMPAPNQQAVAK